MNTEFSQYEVALPDDFSDYMLKRMCEIMQIDFEKQKYDEALKNEDLYSSKCICIFRDKTNENRFIMLDTHGPNFIHSLIVRCMGGERNFIKKSLINLVNEVTAKYGHESIFDLEDKYSLNSNGYNEALKRCNVDKL